MTKNPMDTNSCSTGHRGVRVLLGPRGEILLGALTFEVSQTGH